MLKRLNVWLFVACAVCGAFVSGLQFGYSIHPTKVLYHEAHQAQQEFIKKTMRSVPNVEQKIGRSDRVSSDG